MASTVTFRPYTRKLHPDARWLVPLRGQVYGLDGNIGAGKTTLGETVVHYLRERGLVATFLAERIPHELLARYLAYKEAHPDARNVHAHALQMAFLDCRIETNIQAQALAALGHVVFVDRSLVGDYVFARVNYEAGGMTEEEWVAYAARVKEADQLEPTAIIHVDTSVPVCLQRINTRARGGEPGAYDPAYLARLARGHADTLATLEYPVLTLPWDQPQRPITSAVVTLLLKALLALLMTSETGARMTLVLPTVAEVQ